MPRKLEVTVPPHETNQIIGELQRLQGIMSLRLLRGGSVVPAGDVITLTILDRTQQELFQLLDRHGLGTSEMMQLVGSMPASVISPPHGRNISNDTSEATWEEMDLTIGQESNMTVNGLALMLMAGIIASFGIATGALHVVIGAMIIAPGFEPILRISLALASRGRQWRNGVVHALRGYAVMALGAILAAVVLRLFYGTAFEAKTTYLTSSLLVKYWSTISMPAVFISAAASIAGAILVASHRSVLTAGVMIGLALVPSLTIACMGAVEQRWELTVNALLRWLVDVALVLTLSAGVFTWKRWSLHRRNISS